MCTLSPLILLLRLRAGWDSWIYRFCLSPNMGKLQLLFLQIILLVGLILSCFLLDSKNSVMPLDTAPRILRPHVLFSIYFSLFFRLENFCFFVFKVNTSSIISHLLFAHPLNFLFQILHFFKSWISIWFFPPPVSISFLYFLAFPSLRALSQTLSWLS